MPSAEAGRRADKEDIVLSHLPDAVQETTAKAPASAGAQTAQGKATLQCILSSLDDDKAEDVVSIDLAGKSEVADFMVICSGRSTRQVASISEKLVERLKQDQGVLSRVEGKDAGDWVLIDAGDVIVHVFRPEVREFYQLEKMWMAPAGEAEKA